MLNSLQKVILAIAVGSSLLATAHAHATQKIVVLVPGFFNFPGHNSILGLQYFSPTIVSTIEDQGYIPVVFDNLNPVGTVSDNGHRVLDNFHKLMKQYPNAEIAVIAHSAGGLYVAQALTLDPTLPLFAVVTISTPYLGAELIDVLDALPGFTQLTQLLDLSSLREFKTTNMRMILDSFKIPERVRWATVAAEQPACLFFSCRKAENQSWLLSTAWRFAYKAGDGVVSVESALGGPSQFSERWEDLTIPLEHWEAVLDSNFFKLLGVNNTGWIAQQQRESYAKLLQRLNF